MYENKQEKLDLVFLSPPWGGVSYSKTQSFDLTCMMPSFHQMLTKASELAENLILFLPRNVDIFQLQNLLLIYNSLFDEKNECVISCISLVYNSKNIKAILFTMGPRFKVNY